jgi:putative spermidine/putrescine transport system permease protein
LTTLIALPAAFALVRGRFRHKSLVLFLMVVPMMVPTIITGVSLFYLYSSIGLVGTNLALVLGHSVLAIPYVVVTMTAVLKGYDVRLDHAAWTLGASPIQTLRLVTLPILKSGIIAAFLFAFVISFDDLTVSLFLTGGVLRTLPRSLWDNALLSVTPELTAVASLLLLAIALLVALAETARRRSTL